MEQKEKKEKSDAEERERLLSQLDDFGGLWDLDVIDAKLSKLSSEKKKNLVWKYKWVSGKKLFGLNVAEHISQCHLVVLWNPYLNFQKTGSML